MSKTFWNEEAARKQKQPVKVRIKLRSPHPEQVVDATLFGGTMMVAVVGFVWHGLPVKFDASWPDTLAFLNRDQPIPYTLFGEQP